MFARASSMSRFSSLSGQYAFSFNAGRAQSLATSRIPICKGSIVHVFCLSYHGGKLPLELAKKKKEKNMKFDGINIDIKLLMLKCSCFCLFCCS